MIVSELQNLDEVGLSGPFDLLGPVEKFIGNSAEEDIVQKLGGRLNDPAAASFVESVGQNLAKNSERSGFGYKFEIIDSNTPNAFALPNGSVFVTTGLLRLLRSEAQLANVLGHEVAHVTEQHGIKQFGLATGLGILSKLANISSEDVELAKNLALGLVVSGYSRDHERESDEVGQFMAARSGWDPAGMIEVMQIFQRLEGEKQEGIEEYLRSHPFASERVEAAQKRLPAARQALPEGGTGEAGEVSYNGFLTNFLKVDPQEAAQDPVKVAPKFVGKDDLLVPGLILAGGATILLLFAIFK